MKTFATVIAIIFGLALLDYMLTTILIDIVNHTVCQKVKTEISCHYEEIHS